MPNEQQEQLEDAAMDQALMEAGILDENGEAILDEEHELPPPVEDDLPPPIEDEEEELPPLDEEEELPEPEDEDAVLTPEGPTYTYEEWVAEGKDPDDYMSPKMLEKYRAEIGEKKAMKQERNELREMKEMMQRTFLQSQQQMRAQHIGQLQELQKQMAEAKANYDFEGYEEAQKKAGQIAREVRGMDQEAQQQGPVDPYANENPIIRNYRLMEPRLHVESGEYDQDYNTRFEAEFNAQAIAKQPKTAQEVAQILKATEKKLATPAAPAAPQTPQKKKSKAPRVAAPKGSGGAGGASQGVSGMPEDTKKLYNQWRKSSDPVERAAAKEIYETYGGKAK